MARQLWLADVLRAAGLTVVETAGWRERGSTDFAPQGVIAHQTRGNIGSSETGEINVLINGRVGLSGPIAQLFLGRDGRWHVIASGRCNHVLTASVGPFAGLGNSRLLGIEAHWTIGEPWTATQHNSYVRGVAAILRHTRWPAPVGHKEHQPGDKTDPHFDMNAFRREVAAAVTGGSAMTDLGYAPYGKPPVLGEREAGVLLADLWYAEIARKSPYAPHDEVGKTARQEQLDRIEALLEGAVAIDYDKLASAIVAKLPVGTVPPSAAEIAEAVADENADRLSN